MEQQACLPLDRSCVVHSASAHQTNAVHRQWTQNEVSTTYTHQVHTWADLGNERSRRKGIQRRRIGGICSAVSERAHHSPLSERVNGIRRSNCLPKTTNESAYSPIAHVFGDFWLFAGDYCVRHRSRVFFSQRIIMWKCSRLIRVMVKFGSFKPTKSDYFIWIIHIEKAGKTFFLFAFVQRTLHPNRFSVNISMPIPARPAVLRRIVDAINTMSGFAIKCTRASDSSDNSNKLTEVACKQPVTVCRETVWKN